MSFLKKNKYKIIFGTVAFAVIAIAVIFGQGSSDLNSVGSKNSKVTASEVVVELQPYSAADVGERPDVQTKEDLKQEEKAIEASEESLPKENGDEHYLSPETNEENNNISDFVCTLAVRCDTILNNLTELKPEKAELLPADGIIFPETTVVFYEGESVFNILVREMKKNKIHIDFVNTPMYNTAYIKGIANFYERDCGELSGWMYRVNGWYPNYGCSRYQLKDGDVVEWRYTCDLGNDVGGGYATGG